jgi:phosphopentomutase
MKRCFLIVLDGVGVGELPDAAEYGDEGSATVPNIAEALGGVSLPNLRRLGLGNIVPIAGVDPVPAPVATYGKLREQSAGKDSTTGHWEIAGVITRKPFPVYPEGFPETVIHTFTQKTGCGSVLGNEPASGTEIIERLGARHVDTGYPIVYTSADSVFQIATHEQIVPLERLYEWCTIARTEVMTGEHEVSRVIARPFVGEKGAFSRTQNRKDFSIDPPRVTLFDLLTEAGVATMTIGKVDNLFAGRGIGQIRHTKGNREGIHCLLDTMGTLEGGFVFTNLVDFDQEYGHRNDVKGFAEALEEFDDVVPLILGKLRPDDLLILTCDHGNDPTTPSTDHSREYAFLLALRKGMKQGCNAGIRDTFADIAQTCAEWFFVPEAGRMKLDGMSFLHLLK